MDGFRAVICVRSRAALTHIFGPVNTTRQNADSDGRQAPWIITRFFLTDDGAKNPSVVRGISVSCPLPPITSAADPLMAPSEVIFSNDTPSATTASVSQSIQTFTHGSNPRLAIISMTTGRQTGTFCMYNSSTVLDLLVAGGAKRVMYSSNAAAESKSLVQELTSLLPPPPPAPPAPALPIFFFLRVDSNLLLPFLPAVCLAVVEEGSANARKVSAGPDKTSSSSSSSSHSAKMSSTSSGSSPSSAPPARGTPPTSSFSSSSSSSSSFGIVLSISKATALSTGSTLSGIDDTISSSS